MAKMVMRTRHNFTLYIHNLSPSILLCVLAFLLQKLLFSRILRTESDSPPYRIPHA